MSVDKRSTRALPDFALTVYERVGTSGACSLIRNGLLEPGEYECPACEGAGYNQDVRSQSLDCLACRGLGSLQFTSNSVSMPAWAYVEEGGE